MKKKMISLMICLALVFSNLTISMPNVYASTYDASAVVDLALSKVGTSFADGYCLRFVKEMFASAYGFTSSACCAYKYGNSYIDSSSRNGIPIGASVFFGGSKKICSTCGNNCGHIGIYVGNDYVVHGWSGKIVKYKIDRIINAGYPYRGWGWHGNVALSSDVPIETTPTTSTNPDDYTYPTRDLLYTSPVKTGSDVKWVQAVLFNLGYNIVVDGSFGPATRDAVKAFQSDYGLAVDGSCGPATRSKLLEQWNKLKNGNISITLHTWLSNEEYGDVPDQYLAQDRVYLCYELVDSNTWQKINTLVDKDYTSTLTLYDPDGSVCHTATYNNFDDSWISIVPKKAGTYRGVVTVTGDVVVTGNVSFNLEYDAAFTPSVNSVSLNLNGVNETTISCTPTGGYPGAMTVTFDYDTSIIQAVSYYWDDDVDVFYYKIKGLKYGSTNLVLNLHENYTDSKTKVASFTIPVTVTANSYTISYNANGGSGAPSSQTKYYGTGITLSSTKPTRTGYTFLGWSTSSTATSAAYQPGGSFTTNASTTLYAVWRANTYTVKYNANGGSGTMSNSSHTYDASKSLTSNAFTRSGYTFLGWSTNSSATTATYTNGQSIKNLTSTDGATVNLYAVWSAIPTYTVSYNANGGSGVPSSQTKTKDVTLTLSSTKPTKTGYTFTGWNTKADGTGTSYSAGASYTSNSAVTLYAQWRANTYTVKYNANGGSGTMSNSSHTYDASKSLTSNAFTRSGYTFLGWSTSSSATTATYTDGQSVKNLTSTNGATVNLYAVWSKIPTYTISYNANGGSGAPSSQTKTKDVTLTLSSTAPTKTGYTFLGWSTSSTATSATYQPGSSFTTNANTTLYAVWGDFSAPTCVIAGYSNGGSSPTVTFRLSDNDGIAGYYWGTDSLYSNNPFTETSSLFPNLSMDATKTYYFTAIDINGNVSNTISVVYYKIVKYGYGNSGFVNYYMSGSSYKLTTPEREGYTFLGWSTNRNATSATYQAGETFVANANKTYYGVWQANTYTIDYNSNGGSGTMSDSSHTYDVSKALTSNAFTRSGYTFLGWSTSSSATTATYTNGQSVKNLTSTDGATVTLYAVWQENAPDVILGDVNGDNVIDAGDAVIISRYDAGLITLTQDQLAAADINKDGYVDAGDAVIISRYDAGLITTLNNEEEE